MICVETWGFQSNMRFDECVGSGDSRQSTQVISGVEDTGAICFRERRTTRRTDREDDAPSRWRDQGHGRRNREHGHDNHRARASHDERSNSSAHRVARQEIGLEESSAACPARLLVFIQKCLDT